MEYDIHASAVIAPGNSRHVLYGIFAVCCSELVEIKGDAAGGMDAHGNLKRDGADLECVTTGIGVFRRNRSSSAIP